MEFHQTFKRIMSILSIFYLLLPTNAIADGPWKGDNFDSYPIGAWVPPTNGWQSLNNKMWSITYGMLIGKVLWFTPNESDLLVHPSDTSDYEISVQIQHSDKIPGNLVNAGLIGRGRNSSNYYSAYIYTTDTHTTRLALAKTWGGGWLYHHKILIETDCFTSDIDPNLYYTLSMEIKGSDITVTLSVPFPSIPIFSVSYRDDGVTNGAVLYGDYVGVYSVGTVDFHPHFDNFTYRNLIKRPQPWLPLLLGD